MQMFCEVADIQTADMLKLPVPKVNYHNIKTKPSEIQTEMVASLAKRAEKVRARLVEPNIDNMLKITNDGRKLALDQRMIDPMLPDDPDSKVNACVDNVYRIWEEHADTKATQLVFCDLSTPKNDVTFNVYDDMREKLIARGIPAEQIRFIHEATTDAQKKELFGKVRSGEVRVLFGSTPKMGAGTNVQDRLIAIHNLDCPWRPSDLEQRQGRIERQGNMFPEVEVYRYVTEQTFDAYLYQLVESKQKFISQIMTSKSPIRSAEDVDEVALSFAEVKMLATGDARFKEKMDLDIQVSKLRVLKQSYLSEHYDLEDRVLKYYPQTIKEYEERIAGYENDAALAEQHKPQGEDKFCPMTLKGVTYTEKADAGEMLLAICKDYPMSAPTEIGSYRGFRMEIYYDTVNAHCLHNHFVVNSVSFADGMHYHDNKANLRLLRQRSDELCREYALSVIEHPSGKKKPYALYQAEKQGRPTRDNVARQAVDEAISKSFTLKDFDRQLAEMGYRINFDPNRKYWTIIGKGWQRPKRLYKLGEEYTNDRIMERISENSYAVKFQSFSEPQVKVYRVKGSLKNARKIGGLRGLYLHYCYKLGILPKGRKQNYARLHYLLKDDLMKMEAITQETRLLCRNHIDTAEQLCSYKGSLETEMSALLQKRKELYSKSRRTSGEEKEAVKAELSDISGRLKIIRKEVRLCEGIAARSDTLKEKLQTIRADEHEQQRKELMKNEHRRRSGRTNRPNELGGL